MTRPAIPSPATARLFLKLFRAFENNLLQAMREKGFTDISAMHFNVIRHLNPQGMSVTQLAKDAEITKQAVGKIATELANKGYLRIESSSQDGRMKHIAYTVKGRNLLDQLIVQANIIEKQYRARLGAADYLQLRESLTKLLGYE
jgi:DNA-binding MarR family transcriptional regulator